MLASRHLLQRYGYGGWIQLHHHCKGKAKMMKDGHEFRVIEENCWSPEARLADMEKTGIIFILDTVPRPETVCDYTKNALKCSLVSRPEKGH